MADRDGTCQRRVGESLPGGWQLEELIGRGGSAAVYRARRADGLVGAAKIMHPELALDASWVRRFRREISLLERATHPALVRLLEVGATERPCFFVMELLEGQSLERRRAIAGGSLPVDVVVNWADGVLEALAALHANGILHHDIKPSNVFITTAGVLKLLDFGIAHAERHAPADAAARETTSRGVLGTPAYMSPEQARGRWDLVDARSDLWSVAAMLFMLLAGEPVHAAQTENERLGLAMSTPARSLRAARPEIPAAVARVIDRALAYDPADRWANAPDFRRALVEAMRVSDQVDGWSTHTTLQDGASLTGFRRKMRKGLVAGLSLALASALTFGVRLHVRATSTATLERPTMPATASSELRLAAAPARDERLAVPRLELSARERSVVPSRSSSRKTAAAPRPAALAASRSTPARAGGSLERLLDVRMIATHARGEGALLDRRE